MQSFLDRRAILNLKKRQAVAHELVPGISMKSITTPNSPRSNVVCKQIKHSEKSNGSYGGNGEIQAEDIRIEQVNIALVSEKL
jgi:hypothetical protein